MIAMGRKVMKELEKVRRYIYNCTKCGVCVSKVTGEVPYVCPVKESTAGFDHFLPGEKPLLPRGCSKERLNLLKNWLKLYLAARYVVIA